MRRQPPIVRCFIALCFSSAVTLVAIEWRNPFPDPVMTPSGLASVSGDQSVLVESGEITNTEKAASRFSFGRLFSRHSATAKAAPESSVQLVLSLDKRYVDVVEPGKPTVRYEVAVGQEEWQTPTGSFGIMSKIENPAWQHPITKEEIPPGPDNPLGSHWIGFWSDGQAQIGFHGTNQEELIGEAVSHGCVRMRNRDIKELYAKVEVGTVVTVSAE